jgi:predicted dehydrogenase
MQKVLIFGAGSIGNHLAFASRTKGWAVTMVDIDDQALGRTKDDTYPGRYGKWDPGIVLKSSLTGDEEFDFVIVGTPPDIHLENAYHALEQFQPKVLLLEKPAVPPDGASLDLLRQLSEDKRSMTLVGYNHLLVKATKRAEELLQSDLIGEPCSIHVRWVEHWGGIFRAHPWLAGPQDSYLGSWCRGGGACAEHSHGINLWSHFSNFLGFGPIASVNATMNMQKSRGVDYDQTVVMGLTSRDGLGGSVIQDVVTSPAEKMIRVQGADGFLELHISIDDKHDAVIYSGKDQKQREEWIEKTRPDDFAGEFDHVEELLESGSKSIRSSLALDHSINTMEAIIAAHESHQKGALVSL